MFSAADVAQFACTFCALVKLPVEFMWIEFAVEMTGEIC